MFKIFLLLAMLFAGLQYLLAIRLSKFDGLNAVIKKHPLIPVRYFWGAIFLVALFLFVRDFF